MPCHRHGDQRGRAFTRDTQVPGMQLALPPTTAPISLIGMGQASVSV
ncbi:MAG: hypothetical protein PVI59_15145 [Anaerolineae bacterium]